MSKYFTKDENNREKYRIELEDGEWIDILSYCTHGIKKEASRAMTKPTATRAEGGKAVVKADYDPNIFNDVLIKNMIVAWSFTYEDDGEPVPVTQENIDSLPDAITRKVLEVINELNPAKTAEAKNAS